MTKHFILKKIEEYMDETLASGLEFDNENQETAEAIFSVIMNDFKKFIEHDEECNIKRHYHIQLN